MRTRRSSNNARQLRSRRAVGHQMGRGAVVLIALVALTVMGIMGAIGYRAADTVPGRSYYDIKAEFVGADNLSNRYEVRIGGLRAGQVLKPRIENGVAVADLRLDQKFAPLRSDSRTRIRLRSAIGVRYLEIIPGERGRELRPGDTIAAENQIVPVALDEALGTFDAQSRRQTQILLAELGSGTEDNGTKMNDALKSVPQVLRQADVLSATINRQTGAMRTLIVNTDRAAGTFDPVRSDLAEGFSDASRAVRPFSKHAVGIGRSLEEAPPTMSQLSRDLPSIDRLVKSVNGLAVKGRPALRAVPQAMRVTTSLMRNARPSLKAIPATLQLAIDAVDPTLAMLSGLEAQTDRVDTTMTSIMPTLDVVGPRACELSNVFTGWEYLKWGNAQQNFFRFEITWNPADILSGAGEGRLPGLDGKPLLDAFSPTNSFPGPCVNGIGETGSQLARAEESMKGLQYRPDFLPNR